MPLTDPSDLSDLKLLLVDDTEDSLDMLATFLRSCGCEIVTARTAAEALAHLDTDVELDAIVTDVSMPIMDGVDLVRKLRAHPTRHSLPAIAVTGFYELYAEGGAGFDAILRKPVNFEQLCATMRAVIDARRGR
jgi:CheY-like chemotaxis protein